MPKGKPKAQAQENQDTERETILDEREQLRRLFPSAYSPEIGVFNDGKVEVMLKLSYVQAEALARLLHEHRI